MENIYVPCENVFYFNLFCKYSWSQLRFSSNPLTGYLARMSHLNQPSPLVARATIILFDS